MRELFRQGQPKNKLRTGQTQDSWDGRAVSYCPLTDPQTRSSVEKPQGCSLLIGQSRDQGILLQLDALCAWDLPEEPKANSTQVTQFLPLAGKLPSSKKHCYNHRTQQAKFILTSTDSLGFNFRPPVFLQTCSFPAKRGTGREKRISICSGYPSSFSGWPQAPHLLYTHVPSCSTPLPSLGTPCSVGWAPPPLQACGLCPRRRRLLPLPAPCQSPIDHCLQFPEGTGLLPTPEPARPPLL